MYVSNYLPMDLPCFCAVHLDSEVYLPPNFLKFTFNIGKGKTKDSGTFIFVKRSFSASVFLFNEE